MSRPAHPGNDVARISTLRTALTTALALTAFAANSLLCRAALRQGHADATTFTLLRLGSGALVLGLLARRAGGGAPRERVAWASAIALFTYALGFSLAYLRLSAGTGALLLFASVQFTMLAAGIRAGEHPSRSEWAGFALSVTGLIVLTLPGFTRPDPLGALLMIAAGAAWGVYSVRGRGALDPVAVNAASFVRAAALALAALLVAMMFRSPRVDTSGLLLAIASGAVASGLGYAVWYLALRGLTTTRAAIVQLSVPPLAAACGVWLLGESFGARLLAASALVLGGIAIAVRARRR